MRIEAINIADLPKDIMLELLKVKQEHGDITSENMPKELKEKMDKFLKERGPVGGEEALAIRTIESNSTVNLIVEGLKIYMELSENLNVSFHVPVCKKEAIRLYQACQKFCNDYNAMDLEHGKCIPKEELEN